MDTFIQLPQEIIYETFKYSHSPQSDNLLNDINSFYDSYDLIQNLYKKYIDLLNYDENIKEFELYGWLTNNICIMIQDKTGVNGFMNGLNTNFIELMKSRSIIFRLNEEKIIQFFLSNNENKNEIEYLKKKAKYLWSMLTIQERNILINEINEKIKSFSDS